MNSKLLMIFIHIVKHVKSLHKLVFVKRQCNVDTDIYMDSAALQSKHLPLTTCHKGTKCYVTIIIIIDVRRIISMIS